MYPLSENTYVTVAWVKERPYISMKKVGRRRRFVLDLKELYWLVRYQPILNRIVTGLRREPKYCPEKGCTFPKVRYDHRIQTLNTMAETHKPGNVQKAGVLGNVRGELMKPDTRAEAAGVPGNVRGELMKPHTMTEAAGFPGYAQSKLIKPDTMAKEAAGVQRGLKKRNQSEFERKKNQMDCT